MVGFGCKTSAGYSTCEGCQQPAGGEQPRRLRIFKYEELATATKSFSEKNILGKGSHSCVYKAVLNDGQVVAVKRPSHGRRTLQEVMSFDNELEILSKLRYRHLVNLIGFCSEAQEKLLVVEYMENGTLYDVLHNREEPLSWSTRIYMALQAAKAILALHSASPPIIHRDVKSSNILIDRNWNAKLADLGLALRGRLDDVARKDTPPAGTMGYIDPAYQTPSQISSKSDVFSFGILLLEIMSGRKAIDVRFASPSLLDWAVPLIRAGKSLDVCDKALEPPHDLQVVKELAAIAARSVRQSKDRRPTMVEVVEGLQKIRQKLPSPRFGGKPLWAPRIAVRKDEAGEDSVSVSIEASPARGFSPVTKFRNGEVSREDSGRSLLSSVGNVASPGMESSRPTTVQKNELARQDLGQGASYSRWDALSIRNEGRVGPPRSDICRPCSVQKDDLSRENSGERVSSFKRGSSSIRNVSGEGKSTFASDLEQPSRSLGYKGRSGDWRVVDSNGDRLVSTAKGTTQTYSSAARATTTSKPASTPIFDPTSAHAIIGSPLRIDTICNSARLSQVAPLSFGSPGLSAINSVVDRNTTTRKPLETPTFGSKGSLRAVDPSVASIRTAPGLATLGTPSSRFRPSDGRGSGIHDSSERKSNLGRETSSSTLRVQVTQQRSLGEGSGRHLTPEQSRSTTETQQRTSSMPHGSQSSLREESSGRHVTPEQNRSTAETQQRTSSMLHGSQSLLREESSGQVPQKVDGEVPRQRQKLREFLSNPDVDDVELASPQRSPREGSSGLVPSKRNSKGTSDRQQLPFSSKPHAEKLASSHRSLTGERISGQVPQKMNEDSRETQQRSKSSSRPHVQLGSQSSLPEWSSQVAPKRKNKDSREAYHLSSSSCQSLPHESGRAATQKSTSYTEADVSKGGSIARPTVSCRMDMVAPNWDIPEPAGKFYTNSRVAF